MEPKNNTQKLDKATRTLETIANHILRLIVILCGMIAFLVIMSETDTTLLRAFLIKGGAGIVLYGSIKLFWNVLLSKEERQSLTNEDKEDEKNYR